MIKSMTGFARSEKAGENIEVVTEIRSYNSKNLDVNLRIPHDYLSLEEKIKRLISDRISRGRIEIRIEIKNNADNVREFEIDEGKATAYYNALMRLKNILKIDSGISLDIISGAEGVIKPAIVVKDIESEWPSIKDSLEDAMCRLDEMRKKEGEFIAGDFISRFGGIEKSLSRIENESCDLSLYYKERLKERISLLAGDTVALDAGRIAQEAAFLADRCDISEEIVRAKSHIIQFNMIMNSGEPAGRKLNFLLQELNREFNTMGSKTEKALVSHTIVDVKSEIEKIREQVQNIE
ncbi:MAG: YicC/YloC family endoribonuclease [Desulfobacterales bacterium]|nr:YicC/YloC family endoribonuclease [Desulfobacterales bacterium]